MKIQASASLEHEGLQQNVFNSVSVDLCLCPALLLYHFDQFGQHVTF